MIIMEHTYKDRVTYFRRYDNIQIRISNITCIDHWHCILFYRSSMVVRFKLINAEKQNLIFSMKLNLVDVLNTYITVGYIVTYLLIERK